MQTHEMHEMHFTEDCCRRRHTRPSTHCIADGVQLCTMLEMHVHI